MHQLGTRAGPKVPGCPDPAPAPTANPQRLRSRPAHEKRLLPRTPAANLPLDTGYGGSAGDKLLTCDRSANPMAGTV